MKKSAKQNDGIVTSSPKRRIYKKFFLLITLVMIVLGGAFFWFQFAKNSQDNRLGNEVSSGYQMVCNENTIKEASGYIDKNNIEALDTLKGKFLKNDNYKNDKNCLYILIRHSMLLNDYDSGKEYLALLKKAYYPADYSRAFTISLMTVEEMESDLEFIENRNKQLDDQTERMQEYSAPLDSLADEVVSNG